MVTPRTLKRCHDSIQGSSTPLKDKDDALETPRRPITRSQTKEFNDKLNGLQSLIQRYVLISTLTSKLLGFDQIKFLYANDSDFGEIFAE
ncbi:hypothetical protein MTR67_026082 [Solanum verrucosum]|uniref:Uncharacterized protein n=1 Tax=Solanum verrucosum TaxID=315347 RepID=A0AAF0QYA2_SOLVR|nr:hypothetical protein MTR67_026082 [Solanum verrucosum]